MQRAPASTDDSDEAKRAALAKTVAQDLGCEQLEVVLTLDRRYANGAAPRYVIEACGQRALYAETCESYPSCRYVLLSLLVVPGAEAVRVESVLPAASSAPSGSVAPAASSAPSAAPAPSSAPHYL